MLLEEVRELSPADAANEARARFGVRQLNPWGALLVARELEPINLAVGLIDAQCVAQFEVQSVFVAERQLHAVLQVGKIRDRRNSLRCLLFLISVELPQRDVIQLKAVCLPVNLSRRLPERLVHFDLPKRFQSFEDGAKRLKILGLLKGALASFFPAAVFRLNDENDTVFSRNEINAAIVGAVDDAGS